AAGAVSASPAANVLAMILSTGCTTRLIRRKSQGYARPAPARHQFRASEDRERAGARPLDALKGVSPPARRGKQDVGVENGSKRKGYFSCSKTLTKDSCSSSDKRSQS